jgi:hypothetical protein
VGAGAVKSSLSAAEHANFEGAAEFAAPEASAASVLPDARESPCAAEVDVAEMEVPLLAAGAGPDVEPVVDDAEKHDVPAEECAVLGWPSIGQVVSEADEAAAAVEVALVAGAGPLALVAVMDAADDVVAASSAVSELAAAGIAGKVMEVAAASVVATQVAS